MVDLGHRPTSPEPLKPAQRPTSGDQTHGERNEPDPFLDSLDCALESIRLHAIRLHEAKPKAEISLGAVVEPEPEPEGPISLLLGSAKAPGCGRHVASRDVAQAARKHDTVRVHL